MRDIGRLVIHHSASRVDTHTWAEIRAYHLSKGWSDIGYHRGIVNDGDGWKVVLGRKIFEVGAHAKGFNYHSIGVCVEGNYEETVPPQEAVDLLIDVCHQLCYDFNVTEIKGHRELPYATLCPGKNMPLEEIRRKVGEKLAKR